MTDLHLAVGLLAVAANAAAAAWGIVVLVRRRPSRAFLPVARSAQGITLAQLLLGILVLTGAEADETVPSGAHIVAAGGVIVALAAAEALGRILARRTSRTRVDAPSVVPENEGSALAVPAGIGQTAVLTAGFAVVSAAAVLAVTTGWN